VWNVSGAAAVSRVTVNLPTSVWEQLEEAARSDGMTRTEALRIAITIDLWLREAVRNGASVVVKTPEGHEKELVFTGLMPFATGGRSRQ
jgi:hypothetical protein